MEILSLHLVFYFVSYQFYLVLKSTHIQTQNIFPKKQRVFTILFMPQARKIEVYKKTVGKDRRREIDNREKLK